MNSKVKIFLEEYFRGIEVTILLIVCKQSPLGFLKFEDAVNDKKGLVGCFLKAAEFQKDKI